MPGHEANECPSAAPRSHLLFSDWAEKLLLIPGDSGISPASNSQLARWGHRTTQYQPQETGCRQLTDSGWTTGSPWNWGQWRGRGTQFLITQNHHHGLRIWEEHFPPRKTKVLSVEEGGKRVGPSKPTAVHSITEEHTLMGSQVQPHLPQPPLQPQRASHRKCLWTAGGEHVTQFIHFITCLEKPTCEDEVLLIFSALHAHVCC